jgi:large conductance mechanosensitive channel
MAKKAVKKAESEPVNQEPTKNRVSALREAATNPKETIKLTRGVFNGFFEFLKQYSVIGLAIGIVIGDASKNLVNTLVSGFITPLIGLFLPNNQSLQTYKMTIQGQDFLIGQIVQTTISFVVILFILYFTIKILLRRNDLLEKK